ncbi:TetR family transcriptional regulator [Burkholderia pyrrocinia]|uniref:TetR family transcriptional regulator n=1 Tax=Burkholderia pyrrocinia TaxID=60550 RepID=A0A2Z5N5F0_BURPY|nr:TetR/AcrR family transcriptional regulator [Burkholderia pyrrocinia]AXF24791.1 TetR family transcriptional regulator [Burkholderia pyrrocinia]
MDTKRLTRAQRRDATRERLLDAARTIFAEQGYAVVSVEAIATAAGHTRGAFYSNFRSKTDLLFELMRRDHDAAAAELRRIVDADGTCEDAERALLDYWRRHAGQHASRLMWMEAQLQAARDPRFRARFGVFLRERQEQAAACLSAFAARAGTSLSLPAEVLAFGLTALCDGVQSCRAADPRGATDTLADAVLAGFLTRAVFDHGSKPGQDFSVGL